MISEEKYQKLREDNIQDVKHYVDQITSSKDKTSKFIPTFLNSPFVVTLLGGFAITLLTITFQYTSAKNERVRRHEIQQYNQKKDVLFEFANEFVASLNLAKRYKIREIWIAEKVHNKIKDDNFKDGRNFEETRDYYQLLLDKYLAKRGADSFCAQIRTIFDSEQVITKANELDNVMDLLVGAKGLNAKKELKMKFSEADTLYQELIEEMGRELKKF
ncbi:MAG: hypothetical protein GY797_04125 [Deltaproteobacteria bacterium]|nr:hypothetical protein [Deltaproteobacteria bacterium]